MGLAVLLGYMTMLYMGAMIAPGVGLSGRLLVQIPWNLLDWAHAPAFGLLAWLLNRELEWRGWPLFSALLVASAAALVFGLWTEVFQGSVPGRQVSIEDLIIDAAGIVSVATVIAVLKSPRWGVLPAWIRRVPNDAVQEEAAGHAVSFR